MGLYIRTLVFGSVLYAVGYALSTQESISVSLDVGEVFFGLFGAFYAIIIGFIIFIAMDGYNRVRELISAEVNTLQDLRDYLVFVDHDPNDPQNQNNHVKLRIVNALYEYVKVVVEREWPLMSRGKRMTAEFRDTPPELLNLMEAVNRIHVSNRSDEVALKLLVDNIAQVTTHRTNRLAACGDRLPGALRHLVFWISLLAVLVFSLLEIPNPYVQMLLSAINVFSITFIYFIVMDLNDPFSGAWRIDQSDFNDLLKRLAT